MIGEETQCQAESSQGHPKTCHMAAWACFRVCMWYFCLNIYSSNLHAQNDEMSTSLPIFLLGCAVAH